MARVECLGAVINSLGISPVLVPRRKPPFGGLALRRELVLVGNHEDVPDGSDPDFIAFGVEGVMKNLHPDLPSGRAVFVELVEIFAGVSKPARSQDGTEVREEL